VNNPLSLDRAQSVRSYLVNKGVAANRIDTDGKGSYLPVADNNTSSGRARNRRVEIFLRDQDPQQSAASRN
jgi:outer membrane protein OmpA-like peptidoglycan-associated protein